MKLSKREKDAIIRIYWGESQYDTAICEWFKAHKPTYYKKALDVVLEAHDVTYIDYCNKHIDTDVYNDITLDTMNELLRQHKIDVFSGC